MTKIVYVLSNPAMPGYIKIGKTDNLKERLRNLDRTSTPLPFQCEYAAEVNDADKVEKILHDIFVDKRVRSNREFFEVDPQQIIRALDLQEHKDVTPKEDIFETEEDKKAVIKKNEIRSRFNFEMVKIKPGTELYFSKDEEIKCIVVDKFQIEFEGTIQSLSQSAMILVNRMGYNWKQIQGTGYWMYSNETLYERRMRMEVEG
ncbi:GIY-YIG nuclease family protein [Hyphomicrobiales bacterium]|nr:GIY-YIG nuclease family protein [Hyphomicrobiales bacterium]